MYQWKEWESKVLSKGCPLLRSVVEACGVLKFVSRALRLVVVHRKVREERRKERKGEKMDDAFFSCHCCSATR